jgi:hypothetical protein
MVEGGGERVAESRFKMLPVMVWLKSMRREFLGKRCSRSQCPQTEAIPTLRTSKPRAGHIEATLRESSFCRQSQG